MRKIFENFLNFFEKNTTKIYLLITNILLVIFSIWFSNAGLLPFKNFSDFGFFALLGLVLAIYRPGWTFALFVGTIALENINLAPEGFPVALRPYQFFALVTFLALATQFSFKRLNFSMPKFSWQDVLLVIFALSGFVSALGSVNKGLGFKQSLVAFSFVAIYFLVRIYVQSFQDLKRILPFIFSSSVVILVYGIWQNINFLKGVNLFEVMPGRPNATFTEPDWLGMYLVFLLAIIFSLIYSESKKTRIFNFQFSIFHKSFNDKILKQASVYFLLFLLFTVLTLTVSRSAWIGTVIVAIGFLKVILYGGTFKISTWQWRNFAKQAMIVLAVALVSASVSTTLTHFQIFNRAVSTGGLQKITIACSRDQNILPPNQIKDLDELKIYNCRHINLEDIDREKTLGNFVTEVFRADPTVNIRAQIYQKSLEQIKSHPVLGIGWGSISKILGTDGRGAGLNASNIFLEIYLGTGFLGFLAFVILLLWILAAAARKYLLNRNEDVITAMVFVLLGWAAIVVPNLFNSGIFLGFLWLYLAVAVGLLKQDKSIE